MIAAVVLAPQFALDDRSSLAQQRVAQFAEVPLDAFGLVLAFTGKGIGFGRLVGGQQVDGELLAGTEHWVGIRGIVWAEQHQGRVYRQGAEGAGSDADNAAAFIETGDHGNP